MKWLIALGLAFVLVSVGCVSGTQPPQNQTLSDGTIVQPDGAMIKPDGTVVKPDGTMIKPDGTMISPTGQVIVNNPPAATQGNVEYVPFTLVAYEQAKAEGKTIFLEFYANWCPTCVAQAPALKEGLESLSSDKLVAFRVNYKDTETDDAERALAQKFNITYQHTHFITDALENELLRSQEQWNKQAVIEKVGAFA